MIATVEQYGGRYGRENCEVRRFHIFYLCINARNLRQKKYIKRFYAWLRWKKRRAVKTDFCICFEVVVAVSATSTENEACHASLPHTKTEE